MGWWNRRKQRKRGMEINIVEWRNCNDLNKLLSMYDAVVQDERNKEALCLFANDCIDHIKDYFEAKGFSNFYGLDRYTMRYVLDASHNAWRAERRGELINVSEAAGNAALAVERYNPPSEDRTAWKAEREWQAKRLRKRLGDPPWL